jgi:NADH:ubiquinone oxidoreductase subunit
MGLLRELFAWWTGNTIGTRVFTWSKGRRVGSDVYGNIYYEERGGGPRVRRWVIYRQLAEASLVPPAWHGWLHHTVDVPPDEENYDARPWEKTPLPNLTGTPLAYRPPGSTLRSGVTKPPLDYEPWRPNESS